MTVVREKMGDFSEEKFRTYVTRRYFTLDYSNFKENGTTHYRVNNDDLTSGHSIREINKLTGLSEAKVDPDAIAKINYERFKDFK
jgi:hypothetical protein